MKSDHSTGNNKLSIEAQEEDKKKVDLIKSLKKQLDDIYSMPKSSTIKVDDKWNTDSKISLAIVDTCIKYIMVLNKLNNERDNITYNEFLNNKDILEIKNFNSQFLTYRSRLLETLQNIVRDIATLLNIPNGSLEHIANLLQGNGIFREGSSFSYRDIEHKSVEEIDDCIIKLAKMHNQLRQIAQNTTVYTSQEDLALEIAIAYNYYHNIIQVALFLTPDIFDYDSGTLTDASIGKCSELGLLTWLQMWDEIYNNAYTINDIFRKLSFFSSNLIILDATKLSNFEYVDNLQKELEKKMPQARAYNRLYQHEPLLWSMFQNLKNNAHSVLDRTENTKILALEILRMKDVNDSKLMISELKTLYSQKGSTSLTAFFETCEAIIGLRTQLSPGDFIGSLRIRNVEFSSHDHKTIQLESCGITTTTTTSELEQITLAIRKFKGSQLDRVQDSNNNSAKLHQLIETIKKLAGDPKNYQSIIDSIMVIEKKPLEEYIKDDRLRKYATNVAENAIKQLETNIRERKTRVKQSLESGLDLVKKLRKMRVLNSRLVEQKSIDDIEKQIKIWRNKINEKLSLTEVEALEEEYKQFLSATKDIITVNNYFNAQKDQINALVNNINLLILNSQHIKSALAVETNVDSLLTDFYVDSNTASIDKYIDMVINLDDEFKQTITGLQKGLERYTEIITRTIPDAEKKLALAIEAMNTKLAEFATLQKNLTFPELSHHIFDEITNEANTLIGRGIVCETQKEVPELPRMFREITNQVTALSKKIEEKKQVVKNLDENTKIQKDKKEAQDLKAMRESLRPEIAILVDLKQKIILVDPICNTKLFDEQVTAKLLLPGVENDIICDMLLNRLNNIDEMRNFGLEVGNLIQTAEDSLKKAMTLQLQNKVTAYNKTLDELTSKDVKDISSDCQKSAIKFTKLMAETKFTLDHLNPNFNEVVESTLTQPMKTFKKSWAAIETAHTGAVQALAEEEKNKMLKAATREKAEKEQRQKQLKQAEAEKKRIETEIERDRQKKEKEEQARQQREAKELERQRKAAEEQERKRQETEDKKRKLEEEKIRKEKEEQELLKQKEIAEQERKQQEEQEKLLKQQEQEKLRKQLEEKEIQERHRKEMEEQERQRKAAEDQERKRQEAEDKKRKLEEEKILKAKETEERERQRKELEEKNLKLQAEEKTRKEKEEQELLKQKEIAEQERKQQEEQEKLRKQQEEEKLRKQLEEKEIQERHRKEMEEQERQHKAAEDQERKHKEAEEALERQLEAAAEQQRQRREAEEQERKRKEAERQEQKKKDEEIKHKEEQELLKQQKIAEQERKEQEEQEKFRKQEEALNQQETQKEEEEDPGEKTTLITKPNGIKKSKNKGQSESPDVTLPLLPSISTERSKAIPVKADKSNASKPSVSVIKQSDRCEEAIQYIDKLLLKIDAQALFNPDDYAVLFNLSHQLENLPSTQAIKNADLGGEQLDERLKSFNNSFATAIGKCKNSVKESFSFVRMIKVFFGFSEIKIRGEDVKVEHSNTIKFLEALSNEHDIKFSKYASRPKKMQTQLRGVPTSTINQDLEKNQENTIEETEINPPYASTYNRRDNNQSLESTGPGFFIPSNKDLKDKANAMHHGVEPKVQAPFPQKRMDLPTLNTKIEALRTSTFHK